jgi:hypothetical protein
MDPGQLSRTLSEGGRFFADLVILSQRNQAFGAGLVARLSELLTGASESPLGRIERLIAELNDRLPQKRDAKKCSEVSVRTRSVSGSSAA